MSSSPGIIVGTVVLALLATIGGYLALSTRRARRREPSRVERRSGGRRGGSSKRLGSQQIHLDERIESWTRQRPRAASATVRRPTASALSTPDVPQPPPESPLAPSSARDSLIAPVELWFGSTRVGVVPGSHTHEEFERYASVLLSDLPGR